MQAHDVVFAINCTVSHLGRLEPARAEGNTEIKAVNTNIFEGYFLFAIPREAATTAGFRGRCFAGVLGLSVFQFKPNTLCSSEQQCRETRCVRPNDGLVCYHFLLAALFIVGAVQWSVLQIDPRVKHFVRDPLSLMLHAKIRGRA